MIELNDFYNAGFGWICRQCSAEMNSGSRESESEENSLGRHFLEGEAESKTPKLANEALARWADPARQVLMCPRCGITEPVDKR